MKKKDVAWGSLEPKTVAKPKVFVLTGNEPPLIKGVKGPATATTPVKKKPIDMYFKKGGLVKGKGRKKYI